MSNRPTKTPSSSVQRTMTLVENAFNQLHEAGEKFCKLQLQELVQENDSNQLHELASMIGLFYWLSLTLSNLTKVAQENTPTVAESCGTKELLKTIVYLTFKAHQERKLVETERLRWIEDANLEGREGPTKSRKTPMTTWNQLKNPEKG